MRTWVWSLALMSLAAAAVGDQLLLTGQTKDGDFRGYENGRFEFQTTKGKFMKEQAIRVTKLVLTTPQKIVYQTTDGKQEEKGTLKGYDKHNFTIVKGDKDVLVPQAKMKSITLSFEGEGGGEAGGGDIGGGKYPIPAVNLADLEGADLTQAQQSAIDKFKAAKKTFDDFVNESSVLVDKMNKATGPDRIALLNTLRTRKGDEQPLRKELINAYKALTAAFPESPDESKTPPAPDAKE